MKSSAYLRWLKRWIDGSLTAREEQQLDRAAREDAFLQDALEGLRSAPEEKHHLRLDRLREKIQPSEKKPAKVVILSLAMRRIAATLLLLISVGTIWWLSQPSQPQEISMEELTPAAETEISEKRTPPADQIGTAESLPQAKQEGTNPPRKETSPPPAPRPKTSPPAEALAPPAISDVPPQQIPPPASPVLPQAIERQPIESFNGQIVDGEGNPVAGAVILNQSGEPKAISDAAGQFKVSRLQPSLDSTLAIQHFNYQDTTLRLAEPKSESLVIAMRSKRAAKMSADRLRDKPMQALPLEGFDYFRSDSKAYQAFFTDSRIKRNPITLAFTVYPFGVIGNIEILSLASDSQIEQVTDYLLNGPKWVLPSGVDSLRTQITIPMEE